MADYTLSAKVTADSSGFTKSFQSAGEAIDSVKKKVSSVGDIAKDIGSKISGIGKTATVATAPIAALTGSLVKTGVAYKAFKQESLQAFSVLLGSAEAAQAHMQKIMAFAKTTPFAFPDLVTANRKLVAFGMQAEKTQPVMEAIANATAAMGGNGVQIQELADVFAKIQSNGKITGEELNRLSDKGINALAILANKAGISMDDMRKKISDGGVKSKEAIDSLVDGIMNGTNGIAGQTAKMGGMLNALKGTWGGAVDSMKGAWRRLGDEVVSDDTFGKMTEGVNKVTAVIGKLPAIVKPLADQVGAAFIKVVDVVDGVVNAFLNLPPSAQQIAVSVMAAAVAAGPLLIVFGKLIGIVGTSIKAFSFLLNPVSLVIAAIVGLGLAFKTLMDRSETFRNTVNSLLLPVVTRAKAVFEEFQPIINNFGKVMNTTGGIVKSFFTDFSRVAELNGVLHAILPQGQADAIFNGLMRILHPIADLKAGFQGVAAVAKGNINTFEDLNDSLDGAFGDVGVRRILAMGQAFGTVREKAVSVAQTVGPAIGKAFSSLGPIMSSALGNAIPTMSNMFNVLIDVIASVISVISSFVTSVVNGFKTAGVSGGAMITTLGSIILGINPVLRIVISMFSQFGPQISTIFGQLVTSIVPLVTTIGTAIGQLAAAVIPILIQAFATIIPVIAQVASTFLTIISSVLPVLISLIMQLVPVIMQLVTMFASLLVQIMPLVATLVSALLPVITTIIQVVMNLVTVLMPSIIAIIQVIMTVIQALLPVIMSILTVVIEVVSSVIAAISPIVAIVGGIINAIMAIIAPIITFIASVISNIFSVISPIVAFVSGIFSTVFSIVSGIWRNIASFIGVSINGIGTVISTLSSVVSGVFNGISSIVRSVMSVVGSVITGVFGGIQAAWSGLTGFVSGVFGGISSAVQSLVASVRGFVNGVIGGINSAIGVINLIPGVSISAIPQLQSGTTSFRGGFARMNEGGRGELALLPSGTQVIPHDVSMKYAKESARANAYQGNYEGQTTVDLSSIEEWLRRLYQKDPSISIDGQKFAEITHKHYDKVSGSQTELTERWT
ncbi:tape measure protein [Paenibacillus larvae]|uniref:Tape measure protein n=1 Tax=Paenibacillus larvae TaxID=1464 RepID=A0AAP5JPT7_9BACL|nr:tape measure protein [Paenibacillus larvae]AQR76384.1 tape measure domain-containing protein [Paenibacillus larvae subsp. larvae]AVF22803.1 tape measure domain protein [Paenibacillus larvae subsp. larvae]ETK26540.1 phage-related protein [Paenibacillus larvae subsp. larvae DSM 25719]MCY7490111.1 tape measure protein [Paenibacillus larvae]MCY9561720.1 tape measure protein [Paenibacillus larvae]